MFNNFHIGKPFGIPTSIHWTFWLLPLYVFFSGSGTMAVVDTAVILAVFGCVALHELGHALAARRYGIRTRDIVLYPIGGVARLERMPKSPGAEIVIALAGPAVNVAIAASIVALAVLQGQGVFSLTYGLDALEVFWIKLLYANIGLTIFNLIPAFPMDGGRVLRAVLATFTTRRAATEMAVGVGTIFAVGFALGGLLGLHVPILGQMGPMMIVLAAFLYLTGQAELKSLQFEDTERPRVRYFEPPMERLNHAEGWVYDPQGRDWNYWQHGRVIKRMTVN